MPLITRVPVDVVDIAEGLRDLARLFEKYPTEDGDRDFTRTPLEIIVPVASVSAVRKWAGVLSVPVESREFGGSTHSTARADLGGVSVRMVFIGREDVLKRSPEVHPAHEEVEP